VSDNSTSDFRPPRSLVFSLTTIVLRCAALCVLIADGKEVSGEW
jgi:hypothetical protein